MLKNCNTSLFKLIPRNLKMLHFKLFHKINSNPLLRFTSNHDALDIKFKCYLIPLWERHYKTSLRRTSEQDTPVQEWLLVAGKRSRQKATYCDKHTLPLYPNSARSVPLFWDKITPNKLLDTCRPDWPVLLTHCFGTFL